jgi:hypothetical protein
VPTSWTEQSQSSTTWDESVATFPLGAVYVLFDVIIPQEGTIGVADPPTFTEQSISATSYTEQSVSATSWTEGT